MGMERNRLEEISFYKGNDLVTKFGEGGKVIWLKGICQGYLRVPLDDLY